MWINYVNPHNKNKRREAAFIFIEDLTSKCSMKSNGKSVSTNLRVKFEKISANFKLFSKISLVLCAILRFAQVLMVFKCISLCMLYILARLPDPLCGCLEGGRLYVFPNVRKAMLCPGFSCIHLRSCRQIYGGGSHLPTLLCFPILPACKMRGRRLFSPSV